MKLPSRAILVPLLILFVGVGTAKADTLLFQLSGPVAASFELDSNPLVSSPDIGFGFNVVPQGLTINGLASNDFLTFFNNSFGGAVASFSDPSNFDFSLVGPQLYSGSEDAPLFASSGGPIALTDFDTGAGGYFLTITAVTASAPEPASLLLLGAGLLPLMIVAKRLL